MSVKKPSETEEEYFAREDAVRRHAMAVSQAKQLEQTKLAEMKALHWMKCPKCGFDLEQVKFHDVTIEKCFHCNGTFLDDGELELLAGKDHSSSLLNKIVSVFKRG